MELTLEFGAFLFVLSAVMSVMWGFIVRYLSDGAVRARLNLLDTRVDSLEAYCRGMGGNAKIAERKERENAAMAELALMMQDPKADKGTIIKTMIGKYPDVAFALAKKMGIGI